MDRLDFFCAVCGATIDGDIAANSVACRGCGAGWRTMELASGLLGEVSRGCHVVLRRFARDAKFQRCRILDLSFDPIIQRELRDLPAYRKIIPGDHAAPTQLPFRDGVMDALIVREAVRTVSDVGLFLRGCFRVLAHGGSLILQDRYRWPLPDETAAESDGPGTGFLAEASNAGFLAYFERPAMSVDPLYRSGFIVGIKP